MKRQEKSESRNNESFAYYILYSSNAMPLKSRPPSAKITNWPGTGQSPSCLGLISVQYTKLKSS